MAVIDYKPDLKIRNLEQLSAGTGCKFLSVINSTIPGEFIAKRWHRKLPVRFPANETIIRFS